MKSIAVAAFALFALLAAGPAPAAAQAIDGAWAEPFVGAWGATLETPDGDAPVVIHIAREGDAVSVRLGDGGDGGLQIENVSRSGDALVASYMMEYQGMDIPAVIRMTVDGDALATNWSFADGMYETSARATRR